MSNNNNNRRQTLGGLSPAALNARQSLGPARIVKDVRGAVKGTGLTGRPSLAPGRGPAPSRLGGPAAIVPRRQVIPAFFLTQFVQFRSVRKKLMRIVTDEDVKSAEVGSSPV